MPLDSSIGLAALALVSIVLAVPHSRQETSPLYSISTSSNGAYGINVMANGSTMASNTAILIGTSNSSMTAVNASQSGEIPNGGGRISTEMINRAIFKVSVNTTSSTFVGAQFAAASSANYYGVWEYPWFDSLTNANVSFDFKGVGYADGVNWDNARAPFFFTSDGYGVYADTLSMGSFDFTTPGQAQFIFNTSSLVYYIIMPDSTSDFKSILQKYTALSATIEMPSDNGYGPTFWSDNFEQDFHNGVTNAQENYYDVINHLYYNQIHATSMFADRPYGSGNNSFGNFDFDPVYYPTPEQFIANLSTWGFDFQVWAANRAFYQTELYNVSAENGWLFTNQNPEFFLGPALNLSIPAAYAFFKEHLSYYPSVGVKGYKIDRGEEEEMPVYEQNIQMTLFEQLCYETMVEEWGESNFYNFARSSVDRSRSRTNIWNGDSHSNYSGLAYSVASGIRSGLVGFPVWGSDTGGFVRGLNDPSEELWARWMQFSTFSPVYEIMIGTNHTPWYPPYTSSLLSILKDTANLHHSLIPYIKSQTYLASQTGLPIIRALFLEAPTDSNPAIYTTTDAYFFGDSFLIAPIVTNSSTRTVYFPQLPSSSSSSTSPSYLEYFNKTTVHPASTSANITLPSSSIPAFVRAGALIPRGDIVQGNAKWVAEYTPSLSIEAFPSFAVPSTTFPYFDGRTETVEICMQTYAGNASVSVSYGDFGNVSTSLLLFVRVGSGEVVEGTASAAVRNVTLQPGGGQVWFEDVVSLFDS